MCNRLIFYSLNNIYIKSFEIDIKLELMQILLEPFRTFKEFLRILKDFKSFLEFLELPISSISIWYDYQKRGILVHK